MKNMRIAAALLACLILAMAFVTGCSDLPGSADAEDRAAEEPADTPEPTEEPTPEPTEEPTQTAEPTESFLYNTFGTGESEVLFTNSTDFVFKSLQVQGPAETDFAANLLAADQSIQQGETFALKYTPKPPAEVTPDPAEEILFDDNVYNIQLTTDAGEKYVLYDNDLTVMGNTFVRWDEEGDVLYIEFQNKNTGDVINTLEAQLFMKDLASGAIDETPAQEAAAISSHSGTSSSSGSSSGSSSSGSGSGSSSGSGGSSSGSSGSGSSGGSSSGSSGSAGESSGGSSSGDSSGSDSSGSSSGGGDDWSSGDAGTDDCLEDNIIWND